MTMPMPKTKKTYLVFQDVGLSKSGITRHVRVSNLSGQLLGAISWRPGWRRYAFFVQGAGVVLDADCLHALADELELMMADHRAKATGLE